MPPEHIVIVGAGIIGCTTAYYLSRHQVATRSGGTSPSASSLERTKITIIEASKRGPAQGASGKAGGLVAKWARPEELARLSFGEHVRLAEEHGGAERWGWRLIEVGEWKGRAGGEMNHLERIFGEGQRVETSTERTQKGLPPDLTWVNEELTESYTSMAAKGDSAQVQPYASTTGMFELAMENGVEFIQGRAISLDISSGRVTGVLYNLISVDDDPSVEPKVKTLEADVLS